MLKPIGQVHNLQDAIFRPPFLWPQVEKGRTLIPYYNDVKMITGALAEWAEPLETEEVLLTKSIENSVRQIERVRGVFLKDQEQATVQGLVVESNTHEGKRVEALRFNNTLIFAIFESRVNENRLPEDHCSDFWHFEIDEATEELHGYSIAFDETGQNLTILTNIHGKTASELITYTNRAFAEILGGGDNEDEDLIPA